MSNAWSKGSTTRWRRIRAAILAENLARTGGACQLAIPGVCTGQQQEVHHIHGRAQTGDNPAFLMAVCSACNKHVGDPTKGRQPAPTRTVKLW